MEVIWNAATNSVHLPQPLFHSRSQPVYLHTSVCCLATTCLPIFALLCLRTKCHRAEWGVSANHGFNAAFTSDSDDPHEQHHVAEQLLASVERGKNRGEKNELFR